MAQVPQLSQLQQQLRRLSSLVEHCMHSDDTARSSPQTGEGQPAAEGHTNGGARSTRPRTPARAPAAPSTVRHLSVQGSGKKAVQGPCPPCVNRGRGCPCTASYNGKKGGACCMTCFKGKVCKHNFPSKPLAPPSDDKSVEIKQERPRKVHRSLHTPDAAQPATSATSDKDETIDSDLTGSPPVAPQLSQPLREEQLRCTVVYGDWIPLTQRHLCTTKDVINIYQLIPRFPVGVSEADASSIAFSLQYHELMYAARRRGPPKGTRCSGRWPSDALRACTRPIVVAGPLPG